LSNVSGRVLVAASRSRRRRQLARVVLRTAVPLVPRRQPPSGPIFIVGSPRSGTTLVHGILKRSTAVASLPGESHLLGQVFHPSERADRTTHELGREDVTEQERRVIAWVVDRIADGRRYLDKAPRNSLRMGYLRELFPDAWFLFVKRDGRAAVSSLITAWRSETGMFVGMPVSVPLRIEGYEGTNWKFVIPRGWEDFAQGHTLAEVCAFQWRACVEAILSAREEVPAERWVEVAYEDVLDRPREEIGRVLAELGLPLEAEVLDHAVAAERYVSRAVTAPRPDKWRHENPEQVDRILPMIAPIMRRLGYGIDA
jgi:hypothetical protein